MLLLQLDKGRFKEVSATIFYKKNIFSKSVSWKKNMYDDDKLHDLNNKETEDIQRFSWLLQKLHNSFRRGTCSHQNWWRSSLLSKTEKMVTYDYHHLIFQQHIVMLLRITSKWTHQTTKVISIILKNKRKVILSSFCFFANCTPSEIVLKKSRDKEQAPNNSKCETKI